MPGRRKRRKSRKQSLVFTESPIHNQKHIPTPVLCVDNPVTAKPVPVEEDLSWVSPQFRDIRSVKKRGNNRHVQKYHSTIITRSCHPSNKENTTGIHHKISNYKDKYKSLNFRGDRSIDGLEDISFNTPSPATKRRQSPVLKDGTRTPVNVNLCSLKNLKRSRKAFDISFSECLDVSKPTVRHMNHTLNIPIETDTQEQVNGGSANLCSHGDKNTMSCSPARRQSFRIQAKYLQACDLFKTPPNRRDMNVKILVKDTPECDYNLTVRGRQLRRRDIFGYNPP